MKNITDRDAVWHFFNDRLGLHHSEDFRGVCHFLDRDSLPGTLFSMDAVSVAVAYNCFVGRTCCMHTVIQRPEGVTPRVVREAFEFPFLVANCEAVLALVDSENDAALDFDKRLGFREIATVPHGGPVADLVILRMLRGECRWLRKH